MKLYVGEDGQYDGRILIESFNTKSDKGEGAWSEYYIIPRQDMNCEGDRL